MSVRLDTLQARYQLYIDAEAAILGGAQSYEFNGRKLQRGDLGKITGMVQYLEVQIERQTRIDAGQGSRRSYGVIPRDV